MIVHILLFVAITVIVGLVNLVLSHPLEHPPHKEFLSYLGVVVGGIAAFTCLIVATSALFQ